MSEEKPSKELDALRQRIDSIDKRLVDLLNERADVVVRVGEFKRGTDTPIYAPHREAKVLGRVRGLNQGPLQPRTLESIYRELMSGSFALEQPLRIGYVGPPGSFAHEAAVKHFGSSVSFENLRELDGVFTEVEREHVDYGLVPIETPLGSVARTIEGFAAAPPALFVYAEVVLDICHALLANCEPREVKRIYGTQADLGRCRNWIATQFPAAQCVPSVSTEAAVRRARNEQWDEPGAGVAAIGTRLAGRLYGVNVLFETTGDRPSEVARYLVIARTPAQPSGDDKTVVLAHAPRLAQVTAELAKRNIPLELIVQRPRSRGELSPSMSILEIPGHRDQPDVAEALAAIALHADRVDILGSYPRKAR